MKLLYLSILFFAGSLTVQGAITVTGKHCAGEAANGGSGPASETCTWSAPPAVGETIHCVGYNNSVAGQTSTVFSISDSAGNTYTTNGPSTSSTQSGLAEMYQFFDAVSITASPVTTSVSVYYWAAYQGLSCFSTTGEATVSPADSQPAILATSANAATLSTTISPVASGDLAECTSLVYYLYTVTPGNGYRGTSPALSNLSLFYKVLSAPGAQTVSVSISGTGQPADLLCALYKVNTTGTTPAMGLAAIY